MLEDRSETLRRVERILETHANDNIVVRNLRELLNIESPRQFTVGERVMCIPLGSNGFDSYRATVTDNSGTNVEVLPEHKNYTTESLPRDRVTSLETGQ